MMVRTMVRTTIVLLARMLVSAVALAATPPVVVEPRDDTLGLGRAGEPSAVTPRSVATVTAPASVEHVPSANPLWAIPLLQLSATRERPLFAPSRRPPPPVVAYQLASAPPPPPPKPAEPEKPRMSLVGTIAGGAEGIGVFLDTTTRGVLRLKLGEAHEGWVLRAVRRREATLQKGSQVAVLTLPPPEMSKAGFGSPALGSPGLAGPGLAPPNRAPQGAFPAQGDPGNAAGASLPPASNASGPSPAQANPFAFPTPVVPAAATANPMRDQQTNRR
jgi:general secretion pathway protein N